MLISGSGTNLQALIDGQTNASLPINICAVVSNKDHVQGLERAQKHHIPTFVIDHKQFDSRAAFDTRLREIIDAHAPELVILAGFMRILTPEFTRHYAGRMINIHPSLLPKHQGLHTHRRALEAGDTVHGATVHFVTAELDGGPAIVHGQVTITADDTESSLAAKVLRVEHQIFPWAVKMFAEKRLAMREGKVIFDGDELAQEGVELKP